MTTELGSLNVDVERERERESLKSFETSRNFGHFYTEVIFGLQGRSLLQRTRGEARQIT